MTRFYSKSVLAVIISVVSGLSANSLTIIAPMELPSVFSCSSNTTGSGTPSDPPTDPPDDPPVDPPIGPTFPSLTTTADADEFTSRI